MSENGEPRTREEPRGRALHVVFGTGPVGLAVAHELSKRGKRVRPVNRSGRAAAPEGAEVRGGDATDATFTREASAGASVVYNALNVPYHRRPELFPSLRAGVMEGAAAAGARLVAMENLYMYGPTGGRPMTEDMPYAADTRKGEVRAGMSEELFAAHEDGKVRAVAGRASDFFGPRVTDSAAGETVFGRPPVAGKGARVAGDPGPPHTCTYVPDVGKGLAVLGEREEALGRAWHLPSAETVTTRRFVGMVFEESGAGQDPTRTEGLAQDPGALQPCRAGDRRDALRVRGAVRRGPLPVRPGVRRPRHAAPRDHPRDGSVVRGEAARELARGPGSSDRITRT